MKNYLSLSIWGGGPGRPHDNAYIAKKLLLNEDGLYLSFEDGEECRVFRPEGVVLSDQGIRIENAEKIVWKFYCYGEPQREAALTTITWQRIDRQQVRLSARGVVPAGADPFRARGDCLERFRRDQRFAEGFRLQ